MSRYEFRLAAVRRLREQTRDEARGRLAEAHLAAEILARKTSELETEAASLRSGKRAWSQGESVDVNRLLAAQRYELVIASQRQLLVKQQEKIAAEIETRHRALVEAERQVRALDLLDERQQEVFFDEEARREAAVMDEIASQQFLRVKQAASDRQRSTAEN